jgi:hypothetical protein
MIGTTNVGARKVIRNAEGKIVGTFIPSKKHFGKIALTRFLAPGITHTTIQGQDDWAMITERNPDWIFENSYFTVECKKDGGEVVIQLTHSTVDEWNTTVRVAHEMGWQDKFLLSFRDAQRILGRETHIGNFADLTV